MHKDRILLQPYQNFKIILHISLLVENQPPCQVIPLRGRGTATAVEGAPPTAQAAIIKH